jgi:hypothetical protein
MAKKKKKGKKGGKTGKKGKGGKAGDKQAAEEAALAFGRLLATFKSRFALIAGLPPDPAFAKAVKGPSPDNADEDPAWYDATQSLRMADVDLGPAGARALAWAILGTAGKASVKLPKLPGGGNQKKKKAGGAAAASDTNKPGPPSYTRFKDISMIGCKVRDAGALALCEVLTAGQTCGVQVSKMELLSCEIGTRGAEALGHALQFGANTGLRTLRLDYNKTLGNGGLQALCVGLRGNQTLETLSVRCCGLEGVQMGACTALLLTSVTSGLRHLELAGNRLGCRGLSVLSRALKKNTRLESLGLAENGIDAAFDRKAGGGYDVFMKAMNHLRLALQMNQTLLKLDFSFTSITEDGARQLLPALDPESPSRNQVLKWFKLTTLLSQDLFKALVRTGKAPADKKKKKGKGKGGKGKGKKKKKKKKK